MSLLKIVCLHNRVLLKLKLLVQQKLCARDYRHGCSERMSGQGCSQLESKS